MNESLWTTVAVVLSIVLALTTLLASMNLVYRRTRASRYDDERRLVELELMRRSTETKLNELTERLVATESRWRDVNHLVIDSQGLRTPVFAQGVELTPFLRSAGLSQSDLIEDSKLVFVLMPFHPQYRETFEVIRDVCSDLGLRAVRGDEDFVPDDLLSHILRMIAKARIVIAVLDGRNPNVYYELGIAHSLGKRVILVSADGPSDLPFDLRNRRVLLTRDKRDLAKALGPEITRSIVSP